MVAVENGYGLILDPSPQDRNKSTGWIIKTQRLIFL